MLKCERIAVLLDAFRTSELSPDEDRQVKCHLASCEQCRSELAEVEHMARALASARVTAPASVHRRVMGAVGDRLGSIDTSLGPVWVGFNERGLTFISLEQTQSARALELYCIRLGRP
ncbi:MAG TPA: zf-HC2 domain-containing protein, partial [Chloroflexota bacterium]|nr:zf-HC2 domain-containing protein [Chloroflexota bacterium]